MLVLLDYYMAIQLKPDYAEAYYYRGMVYKAEQKKDEAIADFKKVLELNIIPDLQKKAQDRLKELGVN